MALTLEMPIYAVAIIGALIVNVGVFLRDIPKSAPIAPSNRQDEKKMYNDVSMWLIIITLISVFLAVSSGVVDMASNTYGNILAGISIGMILCLIFWSIRFMWSIRTVLWMWRE